MSTVPVSPSPVSPQKKNRKVSVPLFLLLLLTLVATAVILVGWGGSILGEYNKKDWFVASEGTATDITSSDAHVQTAADQYKKLKIIAGEEHVGAVFERIYAGNESYEKIVPEDLGQYSIDTFFFYDKEADGKKAYDRMLQYLNDLGYVQDSLVTASDTTATLIRPVSPKDEGSEGSPGNDSVSLFYAPTSTGKTRVIFMYQSTELTLAGIPADPNFDYYTVEQAQKLNNDIASHTVNSCDYQPNGVVGGWDPAYGCYFDDLAAGSGSN